MPARRIISSAGVLCSGGRASRPLRRRRNPFLPIGCGRAGRLTAFSVRGSSRLPMRALKSSRYFRTGRRIPPTQPHSAAVLPSRAVQSPHWFGCMFLWWTRYAWPRRHTHLRIHAREGSHPARHDIKHPRFYLFENSKRDILFTRRRLLWKTNP